MTATNSFYTRIAPEDGSPLNSSRILACSAISKMTASIITYPHEVLRTRLQVHKRQLATPTSTSSTPSTSAPAQSIPPTTTITNHPPLPPLKSSIPPQRAELLESLKRQEGLVATAKAILLQDGWRGFYRGISINLVRTVPSSAVTMLTYVKSLRDP